MQQKEYERIENVSRERTYEYIGMETQIFSYMAPIRNNHRRNLFFFGRSLRAWTARLDLNESHHIGTRHGWIERSCLSIKSGKARRVLVPSF